MRCLVWLMGAFLWSLLWMALIHLLGFKIYRIILNVTLLHFSLERDLFWKTLMLF
jgi:hypothetical protein